MTYTRFILVLWGVIVTALFAFLLAGIVIHALA